MDKLLVSPSPHLHAKTSTTSLMRDVVIAMLPAVVVSVLFYGWSELLILGVSVASCVLLEYLITKYLLKRPCTVGDWSAAVTGVLLALNLPATTPWWVVLIGAIVAIGVAKMTFGGIGQNLFNPAIAGRVFLLISFPTYMTDWTRPQGFIGNGLDAMTGATPLGMVKEGGISAVADLDYLDMLFHNIGGSAGELSALAILAGFVYLLVRRVIKPYITLSILATVAIFSGIFWGGESCRIYRPSLQPSHRRYPAGFRIHGYRLCHISYEQSRRSDIRSRNRCAYHAHQVFRGISGGRVIRYSHNELDGSAHQQVVPFKKIREGIGYGSKIIIHEYGGMPYGNLPCVLFCARWHVCPYQGAY